MLRGLRVTPLLVGVDQLHFQRVDAFPVPVVEVLALLVERLVAVFGVDAPRNQSQVAEGVQYLVRDGIEVDVLCRLRRNMLDRTLRRHPKLGALLVIQLCGIGASEDELQFVEPVMRELQAQGCAQNHIGVE